MTAANQPSIRIEKRRADRDPAFGRALPSLFEGDLQHRFIIRFLTHPFPFRVGFLLAGLPFECRAFARPLPAFFGAFAPISLLAFFFGNFASTISYESRISRCSSLSFQAPGPQ